MATTVSEVSASDKMRKVVEEEGLGARNLLNWNVIVNEKGTVEVSRASKKSPSSPRPQSVSSVSPLPPRDIDTRATKRCSLLRHSKNRIRSSSVGRNPEKGLRARYWAFLFENLYRAVDEIYQTCEMDESIVESKEAIMMLENYCKEFQALIQWLTISKNYEVTPPPNRPTSLAWEVRKSLPSKGLLKNAFLDKIVSSGSNSKKKADSHNDLLKVAAIQTDAGKSAPGNAVATIQTDAGKSAPGNAVATIQTDAGKSAPGNAVATIQTDAGKSAPGNAVATIQTDAGKSAPGNAVATTSGSKSSISNSKVSFSSVNHVSEINCNSSVVLHLVDDNISSVGPCSNSLAHYTQSPVSNTTSPNHNGSESTNSNTEVTDAKNETEYNSAAKISHVDDAKSTPLVFENTEMKLSSSIVTDPNTEASHHANNGLDNRLDVDFVTDQNCTSNETQPSVEVVVNGHCKMNHPDTESTDHEIILSSAESQKDIVLNKDTEDIQVVPPNKETDSEITDCNVEPMESGIKENKAVESPETNTFTIPSENHISNPPLMDSSTVNDDLKVVTSDVGVQTAFVETKAPTLNKASTSSRLKGPADAKTVATIKKTTTGIQTSRIQSKTLHILSNSPTCPQTSSLQNKEAKKATPPSRFTKSTANPTSAAKGIGVPVSARPPIQRKVTNGPTQELKPFHTGIYEPRLRCASHVPTPPVNYQKFGVKKSSDTLAPNHISRPSQHYITKDAPKSDLKSASTSSLSSTSSAKSWVGKVKQKNPDLSGNTKQGDNLDGTDDADGWETVRGRTRCKNSPAKKLAASQNAIDTAMAAKLSQCKMGGFMYNSMSNSQATKTSNSVNEAKSSKDDSSNTEKAKQDLSVEKKSKVGIKSSTGVLKQKNDLENKGKRVVESKTLAEISKGKKKIVASSDGKNMTFAKGGKNPSLQRQLSIDNIVRERVVNSTLALKKSFSSCSIDLKKKENKQMCQKAQTTIESAKLSQNNRTLQSAKAKDTSPHSAACSSDENNELGDKCTQDMEIKIKKEKNACCASSSDDDKQGDANSPSRKGDEINSNQSSDLDEVLISDELDGMTSRDESMTDAQELEMYEKMIAEEAREHISALGLSWGDQMDLLDMELRTPGRALQMHEKLSSPFRKRPLSETIRLHEEKQLKAQEQRERLLEERAQRFKDIQKKVEEMKVLNEKKAERQRIILEEKLQKAEEKRKKQIEMIVRKAHDEEEKVNEIAFINSLEAQNKRHDLISKEKDHEARLHDIQEERQRKLEEKAAKEAAAEERRKLLEAERQARLLEMQEKRKQRDLKIEQQLMEKEKERQELANQKARDRELRISALNAAQQAIVEELQKKIQLKQEESARRHEENMEQIRQKAFELSVRRYSSNNDDAPQLVPYETKKICTICNVLIGSEVYLLSHLRGKKHQAMITDWHQGHNPSTEELELYNLKHIVDASTDQLDPNIALDKERQKALKKRCKKLRQKLEKRALEFQKCLPTSPVSISSKMQKMINELKKFCTLPEKSLWDNMSIDSLEKNIKEIKVSVKKFTNQEKIAFQALNGLNTLVELMHKMIIPSFIGYTLAQNKTVTQLLDVIESILKEDHKNHGYLLFTNKVGQALDVLSQRLNVLIPDNYNQLRIGSLSMCNGHSIPVDDISGELMLLISFVLNCLSKKDLTLPTLEKMLPSQNSQSISERLEMQIADIVSYAVSIGIVDRLSQFFNSIRGPTDFDPKVACFVQRSLSFLTAVMKLLCDNYESTLDRKKIDDTTQFMATLKVTDLVGVVSLLYCILLHDGSAPIQQTAPPQLPEHITLAAIAVLRFLNQVAVLNLHLIQSSLGSEGLSLQLRHIASYLLWYCSYWENHILLHELILLLGYFTVSNSDNQVLIQAGQCPTVLQQLCALPFSYFSSSKLMEILFPTLLACSYNNDCNRAVLQQEMAVELLSTYLEGKLLDGYTGTQMKNNSSNVRWCLHTRFPKYKWSPAKLYFLN